jgi:hypothetical protein
VWPPLLGFVDLNVLFVIDTSHLACLQTSHPGLIVMVHFLVLVRGNLHFAWDVIRHGRLIRDLTGSDALILYVVNDVLHLLLVNVHRLVTG